MSTAREVVADALADHHPWAHVTEYLDDLRVADAVLAALREHFEPVVARQKRWLDEEIITDDGFARKVGNQVLDAVLAALFEEDDRD